MKERDREGERNRKRHRDWAWGKKRSGMREKQKLQFIGES